MNVCLAYCVLFNLSFKWSFIILRKFVLANIARKCLLDVSCVNRCMGTVIITMYSMQVVFIDTWMLDCGWFCGGHMFVLIFALFVLLIATMLFRFYFVCWLSNYLSTSDVSIEFFVNPDIES